MGTTALIPTYTMSESNQPITLYKGKGVLLTHTLQIDIDCHVYLNWINESGYYIDFSLEKLLNLDQFYVQLPWGKLKCLSVRTNITSICIQYSALIHIINQNEEIFPFDKIIFNLMNFPQYMGNMITCNSKSWLGRIQLIMKTFIITIDQIENHPDLAKNSDYQLTHVGEIRKVDLSIITGQEAEQILKTLRYFFTFLAGSHRSPILPTRYLQEKQNNFVAPLGRNITNIYQYTWFTSSPVQPDILHTIITKIHDDTLNPAKHLRISHSLINWLTEAKNKHISIEISLMIACAGLEYLCSTDEKMIKAKNKSNSNTNINNPGSYIDISESCAETEHTSKKLQKLFLYYGLSDNIPEDFQNLRSSVQHKFLSLGELLSKLRNKITHYNPSKLEFMSDAAFAEARILAIYYLEQIVLHKLTSQHVFAYIDYGGIFDKD